MVFEILSSQDRRELVLKIHGKMINNASATTSDRKNQKSYFLQLVNENKKLLENEKKYCREDYIYNFELENATYKWGEPRECNRCEATRYSDKSVLVYTYRDFSTLGHL